MSSSYTEIGTNIQRAVDIIKAGRVVAVPTGTSYGLAADALQGYAIQRVKNLKQRPAEKTLTVFMIEALWSTYLKLTDTERRLLERLRSKPLTLLVEPQASLSHLAQDGRVGLRVIDQPLMQALAENAAVPLTATSANLSGQEPAFSAEAVKTAFPGKLDDTTYDLSLGYILDGGTLPVTAATTIAVLDGDQPKIIRPGALTVADLHIVN